MSAKSWDITLVDKEKDKTTERKKEKLFSLFLQNKMFTRNLGMHCSKPRVDRQAFF